MLRYIRQQQHSSEQAGTMAAEHGIPLILAQALLQRGIAGGEDVRAFLHPHMAQLHDPFLLPDMQAAVARIRQALAAQEQICIYGDYDADGICATAILLQFLREQGAQVVPYLPSRHGDGYGMHAHGVQELHARGVQLIITVDNGIAAADEIALCYTLGMQVIVTDHHQCPEELPVCEAILNPHRADSTYPYRHLCGAGVALKLVQALGGREATRPYLGVAALATVADVVELLGENRAITALGLPLVAQHTGLQALLEVSGSAGQTITGETLGFRLAPRLNAAGRMGEPGRALELLLAQDAGQAHAIALELNDANVERQQQEQAILREAQHLLHGKDTVSMRAIILWAPHWNPGVIGIVAARLRELYYRPVLLFHQEGELLVGSCRSIPGVHLYDCLSPHSAYFERFGGHAQAAGITMRMERLGEFQAAFQAYLEQHIPPDVFLPTAYYEQEVQLSQLNLADVELLQALAPFGAGNPEPVFRVPAVALENVERMGRENTHLRATVVQGRLRTGLVAFGCGNRAQELRTGQVFDLLCTPSVNEWQGNRRLQLQSRAIRTQSPLEQPGAGQALRRNFYDAFFLNFLYNGTQSAQWSILGEFSQQLLQKLRAHYVGVLILCFTPEGLREVRDLLEAHGLRDRVAVYVGRVPAEERYHTLLLAPDLRALDCTGYTAVYAPDAAGPYAKVPAMMQGQPLYTAGGQGRADMLVPLDVDRTELGKLYSHMLHVLREGPQARETLLQLCGMGGEETAHLALLVFVELGFLRWEQNTDTIHMVPDCPKRDLMESSLYAAAKMVV